VARALAHKPEVLLLDEPFGALDAKIREELRRTIRQVQRELGITTVLVTHDQEEAFALADRIGVMNLGRLLESDKPDELYARPATRFVATFLGAANLLLARQTSEGIRFGTTPVNARAVERVDSGREHEVVAVLRPEEVELAPTREQLKAGYLAQGRVEEIVFTGAIERMRVRLQDGADEAQLAGPGADNGAALIEVTRSQPEQRAFPLSPGQPVCIGVRRIHVLPTPLSSFSAFATTEDDAKTLAQHPLLVGLASGMKTRVTSRADATLDAVRAPGSKPDLAGVAVIASGPESAHQVQALLQRGAGEVLVLPSGVVAPKRILIHWVDDVPRRATLAVSASLLRHVPAEAVYVGILPEGANDAARPQGVRKLLDARSEAQVHGLEMRTELRTGDAIEQLTGQLAESPDQLLILGISNIGVIDERFGRLLATSPGWPVLVVYRSA